MGQRDDGERQSRRSPNFFFFLFFVSLVLGAARQRTQW